MFIATFPAGIWQTNCYLIAKDETSPVVVIDPGVDAAQIVRSTLDERKMTIGAVIATHGHIDHIASAAELANEAKVAMWMHPGDDFMLTDPVAGLGESSRGLLEELGLTELVAPNERGELADGQQLETCGLSFKIHHFPGHSPGCVNLVTQTEEAPLVFSGDVLFNGSIGRTDLPGSDPEQMRASLKRLVEVLPSEAMLAPGHGPTSSVQHELATNPFLTGRMGL